MTLDLVIGKIVLKDILTEPETVDKAIIQEVRRKIDVLDGPEGKKAYIFEKPNLLALRLSQARCAYPPLNLRFLEFNNTLRSGKHEFTVPQFSVYPLHKTNVFSFNISCLDGRLECRMGSLPEIVYKALSKSFEFAEFISEYDDRNEDQNPGYYNKIKEIVHARKMPRPLRKKYERHYTFSRKSYFVGIFPEEIRQKIRDAEKVFLKSDLYLISETKPDEWDKIVEAKEGVVVGIMRDSCFLIDKFKPVSIDHLLVPRVQ